MPTTSPPLERGLDIPASHDEAGPSRPSSAYEDLDLTSSDDPPMDPWSSPAAPASSSRFSVPSSSSFSSFTNSNSRGGEGLSTASKPERAAKSKGRQGPKSDVPLVLGVAVVDFNHLIGPTVEFAYPPALHLAIQDDEALGRLLPFLALPDGAHLSEEDYSYFHCIYAPSDEDHEEITNVPAGQTLFGISCNRQLAAAELLRRPSDVTRSMVQKAVVVIASQPVFGPIRDKLGVVTRAYFAQRDFTQTTILEDFYHSLETSLMGKSGEGAMYIGTSLRELIHKFRHKTLVLLKAIMLQKRVMLFGYPVEMLCTYQYSLVSLMPGLLLNLRDSGSPDLDYRATRARPTSLRSSDRSSLLRYMGLPLHLFGKDAFFQPYLPLQQVESLGSGSWLVGTTNQIVTQQKDARYDLLVNIENESFEFADAKCERLLALTPADRRWMDDVVRTVEETWSLPEGQRPGFSGSDDDLRARFEEYICACLASIKYASFLDKGKQGNVDIISAGPEANASVLAPFGESWLLAFKQSPAGQVWDACTDPVLFDLCEPRHPCDGKVTLVSDLGLRFTEGVRDLHLDQQLAPTREALSSALAAGSSALQSGSASFLKAFDGARRDISARLNQQKEESEKSKKPNLHQLQLQPTPTTANSSPSPIGQRQIPDIKATLGGIGSFFGSRVASIRASVPTGVGGTGGAKEGLRPMSLAGSKPAGISPSSSEGSLRK